MVDDKKIIELENKLAFLEKELCDMNEVVIAQQEQINILNEKLHYLIDKYANISNASPIENIDYEKPPHY